MADEAFASRKKVGVTFADCQEHRRGVSGERLAEKAGLGRRRKEIANQRWGGDDEGYVK